MRQLSLAIVGADYPNKRGPGRRFAIALCKPGDPVELRREPKNKHDEFAVAVFGADEIQLGYVRSERAAWLAPIMDRGEELTAIFQEATDYGCAVRVAFDGEQPTLPPAHSPPPSDPDFWPDEEWPDE
jgi:hypothetical protein